ncbi:MAG: hypothetical protein LBT67_02260 [Holosporaceae bacterium]|nr:hypothetical protein [Holosporaceae bacterium]
MKKLTLASVVLCALSYTFDVAVARESGSDVAISVTAIQEFELNIAPAGNSLNFVVKPDANGKFLKSGLCLLGTMEDFSSEFYSNYTPADTKPLSFVVKSPLPRGINIKIKPSEYVNSSGNEFRLVNKGKDGASGEYEGAPYIPFQIVKLDEGEENGSSNSPIIPQNIYGYPCIKINNEASAPYAIGDHINLGIKFTGTGDSGKSLVNDSEVIVPGEVYRETLHIIFAIIDD